MTHERLGSRFTKVVFSSVLCLAISLSVVERENFHQHLQNFPAVKEMEAWVPLFEIFMNAPSPEFEASLWLQQSFNASSTPTITTGSFLSLLTKPCDAVVTDSSSPFTKRQYYALFLFICHCKSLFDPNG